MSKSVDKLKKDVEELREKLETLLISDQYLSLLSQPGLFADYAVFLSYAHSFLADIAARLDMTPDDVESTAAYALAQITAFFTMMKNDNGSEPSVKPAFITSYQACIDEISKDTETIKSVYGL